MKCTQDLAGKSHRSRHFGRFADRQLHKTNRHINKRTKPRKAGKPGRGLAETIWLRMQVYVTISTYIRLSYRSKFFGLDRNLEESVIRLCEIQRCIEQLDSRSQQIISLTFLEGLTQAEIGARLELEQMAISRLMARIVNNLQSSFIGCGLIREPLRTAKPTAAGPR